MTHHPDCYGEGECACAGVAPRFSLFPLGIADDGLKRGGGGCHLHLTCGCVIVYVGRLHDLTRRGLLTVCWEHDGYWPLVDAARWTFAVRAHLN